MSLCTVAELKAALGVGSLYADATLQEVCDAADKVLLPFIWANTSFAIGHSNVGTVGTMYFDDLALYKRPLTQAEITEIYESNASIASYAVVPPSNLEITTPAGDMTISGLSVNLKGTC